MSKTDKICSRLVEFEERAASLYLDFAHRFSENKELSWFWLEMSREEREHALLLQFCGCEHLVEGNLPTETAVQRLADLFAALENRANREDLTMDDAFLIAAELEGSEINSVYAGIIRKMQGTWYVLRKKIESLVPNHLGQLICGARHFGASDFTMAQLGEIQRREALKAS